MFQTLNKIWCLKTKTLNENCGKSRCDTDIFGWALRIRSQTQRKQHSDKDKPVFSRGPQQLKLNTKVEAHKAVAEMDKLRRLCCVSHSLSSLLLDWSFLGSCSDQIVQRWSAEAVERLRR
ncbi:hypothetical protein IGI04_004411 [Brassica rapa subsp. trilocularis]|uniref:Uncharacterized protein n=1 Tax=Brassica rapa subsp. trilocularis TaxID=1813537 RepID=A0ABQ7NB27_BRACM|nr:hypothetical protein IGI04_004411 [Brassica rapa subsp. trilocularis]